MQVVSVLKKQVISKLLLLWDNDRYEQKDTLSLLHLVSFAAVFRLVTQRSSPHAAVCGEERCVTSLTTAAKETMLHLNLLFPLQPGLRLHRFHLQKLHLVNIYDYVT